MPKRLGNTQIPSAAGLSDIINLKQHKQYVEQDIFPSPENDVLSGLRFDGSSYLTRNPTAAGNQKTWTWSGWIKPSSFTEQFLFGVANSGSDSTYQNLQFNGVGNLHFSNWSGSINVTPAQIFRDSSSWYHIVVKVDTTQATASERLVFYVNGNKITDNTFTNYPSPNEDLLINTTVTHQIGARLTAGAIFILDGYMANIHFIDGQALDPSHFGYYNRSSRQWKPKKYTGTYGGNGFYLPFNTNIYRYFNGAASVNLSGSPITAFPCTVSCWVNLNDVGGTYGQVINLNVGGTRASIFYNYDDNGGFTGDQASTFIICIGLQNHFATENLRTYPNSGWHHLAVVFKSGTNVTPDVYIDGEFVSATNRGGGHGGTGVNAIGSNGSSGEYFSGYITNVAYFDNYTITQEEVTEIFNSGLDGDITTLSVTQPNSYLKLNEKTGTTVAATLGTITGVATNSMITNSLDFSGNYNDWTPIGFSGHDTVPDSPQNTFATLNPLYRSLDGTPTLSEGNLKATPNIVQYHTAFSNLSVGSGKWYCEICITGTPNSANYFGIGTAEESNYLTGNQTLIGATAKGYSLELSSGSYKRTNNSNTLISTPYIPFSDLNIFQIYMDLDAGKVWFGNNNTYASGGNPNNNTGETFSGLVGDFFIAITMYTNGVTSAICNFGQDPTFGGAKSPSTTYTDANGIGAFFYQPPDGALALCTANLSRSVIEDPADYFKAVIWPGDSNNNTNIECGYQPDLVWIKNRNFGADGSSNNMLFNSLSGPLNYLSSDKTDQELSNVNGLQEFTNTGFRPGSMTRTNETNHNYVAWCWKAGGAPSADDKAMVDGVESTITGDAKLDAGTITPTRMSVNTKAGFSIIRYSGNSTSGASIPTGLSSDVDFFIYKAINDGTYGWNSWHRNLSEDHYIALNTTTGEDNSVFIWDTSGMSNNVITHGTWLTGANVTGKDYIIYAWHSVEGYSKFGSYTGNGSSDGPFVYCGFRVGWLMYKRTDTTGNWAILDNKRNLYNIVNNRLFADEYWLESDLFGVADFTSNGFKIRTDAGSTNATNATYIFMAFAEQPFNFTNSR
jgi:hypothetical protein